MDGMSVTEAAKRAVCEATAQVITDSGVAANQIALRTGLTRGAISRYMSGTRTPGDIEIKKIEIACGVPGGTINTIATKLLRKDLAVAS